MKFRKRIKIAKGVNLNIGKKGISSVSVGGKGATLNVGGKGVKVTGGIPGSGISETVDLSTGASSEDESGRQAIGDNSQRQVGIFLGLGIVIMPYIFSWFLMRPGYSFFSRFVSFSWLTALIYYVVSGSSS